MTDVPTRSPRTAPRFTTVGATHTGLVRSVNEDSLLDRGDIGLWLVADGVGGAAAGDWASAQVAEAFRDMKAVADPPQFLAEVRARLDATNARLHARGDETDGTPVATTVVMLLVQGWHYTCLWIGDSRGYLLRGGAFTQITRDHSEVQELIDSGVLTPEAAAHHARANVITRALGADFVADIDRVSGLVHPGDHFLLCTDGLTKMLADDEIRALLSDQDQASVAGSLIAAALAAGGHDNVTVMSVRCDPNSGNGDQTMEASDGGRS